ncbi:MAG: pre-peptidase C-terminal domain-containing protein [Bryobacteraceae bacterium]
MTKTILLFSFTVAAVAQSVPSYTPPVIEKSAVTPSMRAAMLPSRRARLDLPREHWLRPLSLDERAGLKPKEGFTASGIHRAVDPAALANGEWSRSGERSWRLALVSPAATAVRVHFAKFSVGDGQVWLHNDDPADPHVVGPYSGAGIFDDGEFWSAPVHGQRVVLEYVPAADAPAELPFEIAEIAHMWDSVVEASPRTANALPCELDISCSPEWAARATSVARIAYESDGGSYLCSGTLLNTAAQSRIPYFATANHCISTTAEARSVVAYWGYQSSRCNGPVPSLNSLQTSLGATLLATAARSQGPDFTLIRLTNVPSGVTFAGWVADEVGVGTSVTGMHHPRGDFRRVSFGARIDDVALRGAAPNGFYSIQWDRGITEGGSSGSGIFNPNGQLVGTLCCGPKEPPGKTLCDVVPSMDWYGKFSQAFPLVRQYLEDRTGGGTGGGGTTPPPANTSGTLLTSGLPTQFSLVEVSQPTLYSGANGFRIVVPQNATRLEINLGADPSVVDVDLFVSRDTPPSVSNGTIVADYKSSGPTGNENIVITTGSNPPLQAGTYFIAVALFTTGKPVNLNLTATVSTAAPAPPSGAIALVSGQPRAFTIDPVLSPQLVAQQYRIDIPQGAGRVEFRLESATANVDLDLYVRRGNPIEISGGRPIYDYGSTTPLSNEVVTITTGSSPALSPGTYYVAIGIFTTNIRVNATLTATVSQGGGPAASGIPLLSGNPTVFTIQPVSAPKLLNGGDQVYYFNVPQGATRFEVSLELPARADVEFYVRRGSVPTLDASNRVVADYKSTLFDGVPTLTLTPSSSPALTGGTYYIALAVNTLNVAITGRITASSVGGTPGPPSGGGPSPADNTITLNSGRAQSFSYDPVTGPTLMNAQPFRIEVPQGATRLRIQMNTSTPNADLDLYVRFGQAPSVSNGSVVADQKSTGDTGDETILIDASSSPALRAGSYFITPALITRNVRVQGTITATIEASAPQPTQPTILTSGSPAKYSLPAVSDPTLFTGSYGFRITVPEGATNLTVRLTTINGSDADVDLYIRKDADVDVADDIIADYFSEGPDANENIVITRDSDPPLTPGTYYVGFVLYPTTHDVSGTVTATFDRAPTASAQVGRAIQIGVPTEVRLPAVSTASLLIESNQLRVDVPAGQRLQVRLSTTPSNADVDLYVRYGQPITLDSGGRPVRDFASQGDFGEESITVNSTRAGTYYISLGLFTLNTPVTCTLTADLSQADQPRRITQSRYLQKKTDFRSRLAAKPAAGKAPIFERIE